MLLRCAELPYVRTETNRNGGLKCINRFINADCADKRLQKCELEGGRMSKEGYREIAKERIKNIGEGKEKYIETYALEALINEDLMECPFCDGEVSVALGEDDTYQWYFITRGNKENRCGCRLFMESEEFHKYDDEETKMKAKIDLINRWNRRVCKCQKEKSK